MLSRLAHVVLWKCADDVPVEKLYRHHRIAARICMIGFGAGVLMASSMAEFLATPKGWLQTVSMTVMIVSTAITGVMLVPAIIAIPWGNEIEKELKARGLPLPKGGPIQEWLPSMVMKMCFWFVVLMIIASLAHR
jgi:hypothetical protein